MKINYDRLVDINTSALLPNDGELQCFSVVMRGVEDFMHDQSTCSESVKNLLLDLGILENTEEEKKPIVSPHNFGG